MKFCDTCNNLLRVKNEDSSRFLYCRLCNMKTPLEQDITIEISTNQEEQKVIVVDEKEQNSFPVTNILCPKCGEMREAYWTMQQTRGGDEPPTRFYQCSSCDWRWREYS